MAASIRSFRPEKHSAALRPPQSLPARKSVEVNSHACVQLGIVSRRNARCIVEQQRHLMVFRDREFLLQLIAKVRGVDHGGVLS